MNPKSAKLILSDGTVLQGLSFGWPFSISGEVVFSTGMVGYPESLTDPSYKGQILALTYPLIGNYGVPADESNNLLSIPFESDKLHLAGLVVSELSKHASHRSATKTLDEWLKEQKIPGICDIDTRYLTKRLREHGTMLGTLQYSTKHTKPYDPNKDNLVAQVSTKAPTIFGTGKKRVVVIDCGCKNNIIRSLVQRNVQVVRVPWNYNFLSEDYDGIVISNGPGDPKMARATIYHLRDAMTHNKPIFGICLGNQLLALAAGANTYKLKFGHRSQNQPCLEVGTKRCFITSQNHGFAVDTRTLPSEWKPWFINANDDTNEGIRHRNKPFMSVQFHPEARPGPIDTAFLFNQFVEML